MTSKDGFDEAESTIEDFLRKRAEIDQTIREKFQRQITIMFTDIVASTSFFETHGDLEGRSMMQRHNDLLLPIIERHGGRLLKGLGDGLMIVFNEAPAAARSAVEMQGALTECNKTRKRQADQIWVKMAIHTGLGIVEKDDVYGDVVNTSARICSLAAKSEILASQACIDAIGQEPHILYDYVGNKTLKGKAAPVEVHRILWDSSEGTDLRRSAGQEIAPPKGDEATLCLSFFAEEASLRIGARLHDRPALRYSQSFPYREGEVRTLVEEMEQILASADERGRVSQVSINRLKDLGRSLFEFLIPEGLRAFMQEHPARTLILEIDARFAFIPWELLYEGEQCLCLKYAVGKLVSSSQQILGRRKDLDPHTLRALVMANPRGNLPASMKEGAAVRKELKNAPSPTHIQVDASDRTATCQFLEAHLGDYDVFHFAGHSDYDPTDPSLSGLLLADGKFEVGRLLSLARNTPLPSLVFTNGCQSARTEEGSAEDRLSGLASAFLVSGVRHYVGSIMDLFDRSSAAFAQEFYHNLTRCRSIGESLRQARLKAIAHHGEETLTWASYVLYGDPTFRYFPDSAQVQETKAQPGFWSLTRLGMATAAAAALILGSAAVGVVWLRHSQTDTGLRDAVSLMHGGKASRAEEILRALDEQSPSYYQGMCALYLSRGDVERAAEMLSRYEKEKPGAPFSRVMKAQVALGRGSLEEAEAGFAGALESKALEPWQQAECHFGLGRVHAANGQFARAVSEFDLALSTEPSFLQAYTAKGLALERMGKLDGAVEHYGKAAAINAEEPINTALFRRGKEQLAQSAGAERSARIDSLVTDLLRVHREGGARETARDEWTSRPLYVFFIDPEAKGQPSPREGEDAFFSEQIVQEVIGDSSRIHQVERTLLDKLLEELKLSSSQLADPGTALRLGKILSARLIVTGSLMRYKGQLQVSLRAIDTETTRVVASVSDACQAGEDPLKMLQRLGGRLRERITSDYPLRARIREAADGEITLNAGSHAGVFPGMKLKVMEKEGKGIILEVRDVREETCSAVAATPESVVQEDWRVQEWMRKERAVE